MNVFFHQFQPIRIFHQISLGKYHNPLFDLEKFADFEVLSCLRHHSFISGHDQRYQIDPCCPCHHVSHELLVSRHINDPQLLPIGELEVSKTKLDGDASLLFLLETVGINAGESLNQSGLPMIYMPSRTQDDLFHE